MIGSEILKFRKAKKLTRKKLSELSGVSESAIKHYETGLREPRLQQLSAIASALGCSILDFLDSETREFVGSEKVDPETALFLTVGNETSAAVQNTRMAINKEIASNLKPVPDGLLLAFISDNWKYLSKDNKIKLVLISDCLADQSFTPED